MPTFLDKHPKMPPMPPEAVAEGMKMLQQMAADIKAGKADQYGVTPLNVFVGTNGESWCLTEARGIEAVAKSHAAHGVNLSAADIVQVNPLV